MHSLGAHNAYGHVWLLVHTTTLLQNWRTEYVMPLWLTFCILSWTILQVINQYCQEWEDCCSTKSSDYIRPPPSMYNQLMQQLIVASVGCTLMVVILYYSHWSWYEDMSRYIYTCVSIVTSLVLLVVGVVTVCQHVLSPPTAGHSLTTCSNLVKSSVRPWEHAWHNCAYRIESSSTDLKNCRYCLFDISTAC